MLCFLLLNTPAALAPPPGGDVIDFDRADMALQWCSAWMTLAYLHWEFNPSGTDVCVDVCFRGCLRGWWVISYQSGEVSVAASNRGCSRQAWIEMLFLTHADPAFIFWLIAPEGRCLIRMYCSWCSTRGLIVEDTEESSFNVAPIYLRCPYQSRCSFLLAVLSIANWNFLFKIPEPYTNYMCSRVINTLCSEDELLLCGV